MSTIFYEYTMAANPTLPEIPIQTPVRGFNLDKQSPAVVSRAI